ncbi:MAG: MBL fold metallo-hydrolase [Saprospiraceae bacterium]
MRVTFLGSGTSQGVPVIGCTCEVCRSKDARDQRLRVSVHIAYEGLSMVIDAGPDFRAQLLRAGITDVDAILLTHEHNDHVIGLDDVRPLMFRMERPMPLYATPKVLREIETRFSYAFVAEPYPGAPQFATHAIEQDTPFEVGGITVVPVSYWHGLLPVTGFRIRDFAYLTDIKTIDPVQIDKLQGLQTLVISALQKGPHHSHANLAEALDLIKHIQPAQAWLTHISHRMGLHDDVEKELPPGVGLAYDGLILEIG